MTEGVQWIENPGDARVYDFTARARVLAYPSRHEGFGFPPLEAMRLGTPVVAGDTPALREVLGDAALFCDPDDPADLTRQLDAVLHDEEIHADLVARGLARAADFTWRECARAHARVYRELAGITLA